MLYTVVCTVNRCGDVVTILFTDEPISGCRSQRTVSVFGCAGAADCSSASWRNIEGFCLQKSTTGSRPTCSNLSQHILNSLKKNTTLSNPTLNPEGPRLLYERLSSVQPADLQILTFVFRFVVELLFRLAASGGKVDSSVEGPFWAVFTCFYYIYIHRKSLVKLHCLLYAIPFGWQHSSLIFFAGVQYFKYCRGCLAKDAPLSRCPEKFSKIVLLKDQANGTCQYMSHLPQVSRDR